MNIINYNNFKYSSITIDEPIVNNNIMNINMKYNNNNIYIKTPLLKIHFYKMMILLNLNYLNVIKKNHFLHLYMT